MLWYSFTVALSGYLIDKHYSFEGAFANPSIVQRVTELAFKLESLKLNTIHFSVVKTALMLTLRLPRDVFGTLPFESSTSVCEMYDVDALCAYLEQFDDASEMIGLVQRCKKAENARIRMVASQLLKEGAYVW